jgi:hypothetical protein
MDGRATDLLLPQLCGRIVPEAITKGKLDRQSAMKEGVCSSECSNTYPIQDIEPRLSVPGFEPARSVQTVGDKFDYHLILLHESRQPSAEWE